MSRGGGVLVQGARWPTEGQGRRLWWALIRPAPLSCRSVPLTIARGIPTLGAAQVCQAREAQGAHRVPRPGWASSLRDHSLRQPQEEGPTSPGGHWSGALQHPTLWPGLVLLKVWLCLAMTTDDSLLGGGSHGESCSEAVVPDGPAPSVWSQLTSCQPHGQGLPAQTCCSSRGSLLPFTDIMVALQIKWMSSGRAAEQIDGWARLVQACLFIHPSTIHLPFHSYIPTYPSIHLLIHPSSTCPQIHSPIHRSLVHLSSIYPSTIHSSIHHPPAHPSGTQPSI